MAHRAGAVKARTRVRPLAVKPRVVGPHARLGAVWAVLTLTAAVAGEQWLAAWLALATGLAGMQVARARRRRSFPPAPAVAGAGAAAVTLAGAAGWRVAAVVAGAAVAVAIGYVLVRGGRPAAAVLTAAIALILGAVGAAPALLRADSGLVPVFVLLLLAMVYDAGNYVVGSGAASAWEGPAAGIAAMGTVILAVAAVLVPPFRGASPWILGALAVVLAPLGPMLGTALVGDPEARVPALRRVDSLLLLAPVWSLAAWVLVENPTR